VLARPEFGEQQRAKPGWLATIFRDFVEWMGWWLGALREAAPVLYWLLLVGCLALLLLLVLGVVSRIRGVFHAGDPTSGAAASPRVRLSGQFAEEAARRAEEGDFTEAIRCLFLSLVYRLDETGRVSFQKAYTNHEYLELVAGNGGARDGLRVFVDALDECWYGRQPAERDQYRRCRDVFERMR
jgi:hypothetical protein